MLEGTGDCQSSERPIHVSLHGEAEVNPTTLAPSAQIANALTS